MHDPQYSYIRRQYLFVLSFCDTLINLSDEKGKRRADLISQNIWVWYFANLLFCAFGM